MPRTRKEIEDLKASWLGDPIWDLETEEGFEDHIEELLNFRLQQEKKWDAEDRAEIESLAKSITEGNIKLAQHIRWMSSRIEQLETLLAIATHTSIPNIAK